MLVLEQLMNTLPKDVHIFVRERKPRSSSEAGALADDFVAAKRKSIVEPMEDDQKAREKRQGPQCGRCRKLGHFARDCRQGQLKAESGKEKADPPKKPKKDLKDIECFNCHQKGHYSSNCPSNALLCKPHNAIGLQHRLS